MNELVLFYSYSGHSRQYASNCAKKPGRDLCEVLTTRKHSKLYCFFIGCPKALAGGTIPVAPITPKNVKYDLVHVYAPIWAGHMAPPMNTALAQLGFPEGTKVALHMVSAGGKSAKASIEKHMQKLGLVVSFYENIRSVPF
jgi:hypothetical protein